MTYNFLYIDDDPKANILADGFNTTGLINVTALKPTSFEEQLMELKSAGDKYQGIILDLKLDEDLKGPRKAYYSATTLAQQIRTKVSEGEWKHEIPLILFTTQAKMNAAFSGDPSSMRLFDYFFTKDSITEKTVQIKIHAIADAYFTIARNKPDLSKLVGLDSISALDKRMFSHQLTTGEGAVLYSYSKFILSELIERPGPLIDELYVAARLGVDKRKSTNWLRLLEEIKGAKYSGVFSSAWDRWWMHKINSWWEATFGPAPLATLDGRERVEKLNAKYDLNLEVANPLPKAVSYRYWTICQGYESALDPREGLRISETEPLPWQEARYISVEAALERVKREKGLKVSITEKERFENILKSFE